MAETRGSGELRSSIGRYALAGIGPIAGAGAQFALSLVLLRQMAPGEFGSFSFLLVTSYFATGLWNALFCAPMPVLLNSANEGERARAIECLFTVNLLASAGVWIIFVGLGLALDVSLRGAAIFALYTGIYLLRWFARAHAYAIGAQLRTAASDVVFALVLLAGVGLSFLTPPQSIEPYYAILLLSAAAGLLPFGVSYLRRQFLSWRPSAFREYRAIWQSHSGWSVLGVISTEATVNAHVYLVTAFSGAAAYAPIAATALLIRPIGVAQNALTEFERARMARSIGRGAIGEALRSAGHFNLALIAAWVATAVATAALLMTAPRLVFPADYSMEVLVIGSTLWLAIAGIRSLRTPPSVLLQAGGAFRPLATASLVSCGFSLVAVAALLAVVGPLWSTAGVLAGEVVICAWVFRAARRWRATQTRD